ncbi:MAG TPA: hypothetical protein VK096_05845, partial [Actinomycetales bacterium]|nr:hypothetical protein [Actinomycetales bacterium]
MRKKLIKRLSEPHAIRLITAPTGFCKTTAVTVWLEQQAGAAGQQAGAAGTSHAGALRDDAMASTTLQAQARRVNGQIAWVDGTKLRDPLRAQQLLDMVADHLRRDSGELQLIIDAFDHVANLSWDQQLLDLVRHHRRLQVLLTGREPER